MRAWRILVAALNVVLVLAFLKALVDRTIAVSAAIAEYESVTGMSADNDFGQRGVAIGVMLFLGIVVPAAVSTWKLAVARASGFVWHSVLWLVLLMLTSSGWLIVFIDAGSTRVSLQLLCLVGVASGITLSILDVRLSARTA